MQNLGVTGAGYQWPFAWEGKVAWAGAGTHRWRHTGEGEEAQATAVTFGEMGKDLRRRKPLWVHGCGYTIYLLPLCLYI